MGDTGPEHPPLALSKTSISEGGGAKSDALHAPKQSSDPDLALIVKHWPSLPRHIKKAINALVTTAKNGT
jgi:hypothetical protein